VNFLSTLVSAAPTRGTRHVKESLPAVHSLFPLCDPQSDAARAPLPLCPRRAARSLPTPPRPRGTTTMAVQAPPARSSPCLFEPSPAPESAPAPRFAPAPDASSSREARSPMTRSGATAGGGCVFGVFVCIYARERATPRKEDVSCSQTARERGSYTVAIWRVPRVGAADTSVLRKFPGRG